MKNRSAQLLFLILGIAGFLLLELGRPAPALSEEYWSGTVTANVNLRKVPSIKGTIIKGLLKGSPVKIYEEQDGWYRVSAQKYHQVFKGWVSIEYVEITTEAPTAAAPVAETPEPEPQAQLKPPIEEPVHPAPIIEPEKPLPPPAEETPPPEPAPQPLITAEPEPETQAVEPPPQSKPAVPKPERPSRVAKPPVTEPVTTPADDWMHLLPMALPVVAVVVLLIAVIVYRVKRASGKKAGEPAAPVEWSPPLDAGEQAPAENTSFEEALRSPHGDDLSPSLDAGEQALAENTSFEEALRRPRGDELSPSLEEEISESYEDELSPSLEEEISESYEDDLSLSFEDELSESYEDDLSPSLEEEPSESYEDDLSPPLEEEPGESYEDDLSPSLEEELSESFEDDLSPSLEEELSESFEENLSTSFEEDPDEPLEDDLSLALEEDVDDPIEEESSQPLEEVLAEGIDFQLESTPSDTETGDASDRPNRVTSVYDQVTEIINRMSDTELTELLELVNEHQGKKARQDDRLTFYTMVDFVVAGQYYRDFIQDLSVSGVLIKGHHMFEPGQSILMTFMSPYFQKPFKISGEIVRILDNGIGVKFDTESQVQAEAISALVDQIRMLEGEV